MSVLQGILRTEETVLGDERLRSLERIVRADYSDIAARLAFYRERKRQEIRETVRPTMPLPPRPACLDAASNFMWRVRVESDDSPFGGDDTLNPDTTGVGIDELLSRGVLQNAMDIGSRFTGRFAERMANKDLNECYRYLVATVGYREAFAAWVKFGITPSPDVNICVGLAATVVLTVEHGERRALDAEAAAVRRAKKAKLDIEKHQKIADAAPCSQCGVRAGVLCRRGYGDAYLVHPHRERAADADLVARGVDLAKRQAENRRSSSVDAQEVAREASENAKRKEAEAFMATYWADHERWIREQAALDETALAAWDAVMKPIRDRLKDAPQDDEDTDEPDDDELALNHEGRFRRRRRRRTA